MKVTYCERCKVRITDSDLEHGTARKLGPAAYCMTCAPLTPQADRPISVPPSEKRVPSSAILRSVGSGIRKAHTPGNERPSRHSSGVAIPASKDRPGSGIRGAAGLPKSGIHGRVGQHRSGVLTMADLEPGTNQERATAGSGIRNRSGLHDQEDSQVRKKEYRSGIQRVESGIAKAARNSDRHFPGRSRPRRHRLARNGAPELPILPILIGIVICVWIGFKLLS